MKTSNAGDGNVAPHLCSICRMKVPDDEVVVPETASYMVHFCGLDCYSKWKSRVLATEPGLSDSPAREP